MKPFGAPVSFREASSVIDANIKPVEGTQQVRLDDAAGRVLAADIVAKINVPPFDRATTDGYAVRAEDTYGTGRSTNSVLEVIGAVNAGDVPQLSLTPGKCLQISTGAMLPKGADAVVMIDDTKRTGSSIRILRPSQPEANVARVGEDITKGSVILEAGALLEAAKIGLIATQGMARISVFEKPAVAIVPSGRGIMPPGRKLKKGQLYDVNTHSLAAVVGDNGGEAILFEVMGDRADVVRGTIAEALKFDLVVVSGGSPVGDKDLLAGVVHGWGEVLFNGIRIRPGKPTLFALVEGKPLLGMPGFPASCLMSAYLFLQPAVRKMGRLPARAPRTVTAPLARSVRGDLERRRFLPVSIRDGKAVPVFKSSGTIASFAYADGFIEIPEYADGPREGETVVVTLL